MFTLYGCPVTPEGACHRGATLVADGGPDVLAAAAMIEKGVERELHAVALEPIALPRARGVRSMAATE